MRLRFKGDLACVPGLCLILRAEEMAIGRGNVNVSAHLALAASSASALLYEPAPVREVG